MRDFVYNSLLWEDIDSTNEVAMDKRAFSTSKIRLECKTCPVASIIDNETIEVRRRAIGRFRRPFFHRRWRIIRYLFQSIPKAHSKERTAVTFSLSQIRSMDFVIGDCLASIGVIVPLSAVTITGQPTIYDITDHAWRGDSQTRIIR